MYGKKGTGDRDDGWIRDGSGPGSLMFKACLTHTCKVPGLILSLFPVCLSAGICSDLKKLPKKYTYKKEIN